MGLKESAATILGSVLFILGIALSTSFLSRRFADPAAHLFLGEYSILVKVVGILSGLVLTVCGLVVGVGVGNMERYYDGGRAGR